MKIKLTKRAVEARIKRALLEENKKLKKNGEQYLTIDLKSKVVDKVYDSFMDLVIAFEVLDEWEELEGEDSKELVDFRTIDDLVNMGMKTALDVIEKGFGSAVSFDANWTLTETFDYKNFSENKELLEKLINTFFEFYPKSEIDDSHLEFVKEFDQGLNANSED